MSEYEIPFHIQEEIMKRLPVKSLIQFRRVSKAWKSLIDSSEFIAAHSLRCHTQPQHLLVCHKYRTGEVKYVCYTDDDTFPQQSPLPTLPPSVKHFLGSRVIGSSHGLMCLYGFSYSTPNMIAVVWNPLIRKSVVVPFQDSRLSVVGFGVCPVTNEPKMVSITQSSRDIPETSYHCEVMVYTLSSGKWTSLSTNLPTKRLLDFFTTAVTDVFIYWRAGFTNHNMIISFDVTNESFEVIDLPDSLARLDPLKWRISKLRESLAILESGENISTVVWMMEDGVQRSFIKLFTVPAPHDDIVGFRKNGIPIIQVTDGGYGYDHDDEERMHKLVVYEPNSEHNNILEITRISQTDHHDFYMNSYMETLLLLGRPNCNSY